MVFRFQQIRCNMEFLETNLSFWKLIFLGGTGLKKKLKKRPHLRYNCRDVP